jgi:outer membrane protein assembly factor BamE (lipoprotein component of BamABCDE complex)
MRSGLMKPGFQRLGKGKYTLILVLSTLALLGFLYFQGAVYEGAAALFFGDETVYSPGYSETAFRRISVGDTKEHVLNLLGKPLSEANGHGLVWIYTTQKAARGMYRVRIIRINNSGVVVEKKKGFDID